MNRNFWFALCVSSMCIPVGLLAQASSDAAQQAARGEELFFNSAQPVPCASCHAVGSKGTAVGPNLKRWAGVAPRAVAIAIRSSVTENVLWVKPGIGAGFPALKLASDEKGLRFYDLSQKTPVIRSFAPGDVKVSANSTWKHPPYVEKLTNEQIADLVAFMRLALNNEKKLVTPADIQ